MAASESSFTGMDEMRVDPKGRIGIPVRQMHVLKQVAPGCDDEVGIMLARNNSIKVMPKPYYEELLERWGKYDERYEDDRVLLDVEPSTAFLVPLDKQNRIKLTPMLMRLANIQPESEVMISGHLKYMQIFPMSNFEQMIRNSQDQARAASTSSAARNEPKPAVNQFVIETRPVAAPPADKG